MRARLSGALVAALVVALVAVGPASAVVPLTKSRPYEKLCERQGGTFEVATRTSRCANSRSNRRPRIMASAMSVT